MTKRRKTVRVLQLGVGRGWIDISTWSDDLLAGRSLWDEKQRTPNLRFRVVLRRRMCRVVMHEPEKRA